MPKSKDNRDAQKPISKRNALQQVLETLPSPFGPAAQQQYSDLSVWRAAANLDGSAQVVDWTCMPASCDPCVLLDNTANTTRKKGVPIEQQLTMLQFNGAQQPVTDQQPATTEAQQQKEVAESQQQPQQVEQHQLPVQQQQKEETNSSDAHDRNPMSRGWQKRMQVESFATILTSLLSQSRFQKSAAASDDVTTSSSGTSKAGFSASNCLHVVDFGCGTGGLLLPLAHMFRHCRFTGVEMKRPALAILQQRAKMAGLTNVFGYLGMIEHFDQPLDVALGLHACGNATDQVLLLAAKHRAAFVVSPCCVGKIKFSMTGGSNFHPQLRTYQAGKAVQGPTVGLPARDAQASIPCNAAPDPTDACDRAKVPAPASSAGVGAVVSDSGTDFAGRESYSLQVVHPRSQAFRCCLPDPQENFKLIASFADTNFVPSSTAQESLEAVSRGCKLHVELDRLMAAREAGYVCALHRIMPSGTTAKEELLVGVPCEVERWTAWHSHLS